MRLSARLCKKLRGLARARSVGLPERRLIGVRIQAGPPGRRYTTVQAVNDPKSTRGLYRAFKKAARAAGRLK